MISAPFGSRSSIHSTPSPYFSKWPMDSVWMKTVFFKKGWKVCNNHNLSKWLLEAYTRDESKLKDEDAEIWTFLGLQVCCWKQVVTYLNNSRNLNYTSTTGILAQPQILASEVFKQTRLVCIFNAFWWKKELHIRWVSALWNYTQGKLGSCNRPFAS